MTLNPSQLKGLLVVHLILISLNLSACDFTQVDEKNHLGPLLEQCPQLEPQQIISRECLIPHLPSLLIIDSRAQLIPRWWRDGQELKSPVVSQVEWQVFNAEHLLVDTLVSDQLELSDLSMSSSLEPIYIKLHLTLSEEQRGGCPQEFEVQRAYLLTQTQDQKFSEELSDRFPSLPPSYFDRWVDEVVEFEIGERTSPQFASASSVLGPPSFEEKGNALQGDLFDQTTSLGAGGKITVRFDSPLVNSLGDDLGVYENSFNGRFLELAQVGVSSDGLHFAYFDVLSIRTDPVGSFEEVDPLAYWGLAGNTPAGLGVGFDLANLVDHPLSRVGLLDLSQIRYIQIQDIIGDGSYLDASDRAIFDPTPTRISAGFDLDAIGGVTSENRRCQPLDHPQ